MKKTIQVVFISLTVLFANVASAKDDKNIIKSHQSTQQDNIVHYDNNRELKEERITKAYHYTQQGNVVHYDNNCKKETKK